MIVRNDDTHTFKFSAVVVLSMRTWGEHSEAGTPSSVRVFEALGACVPDDRHEG